jgi:hypothetical protein
MNTLENDEKSVGDHSPKENLIEKSYGGSSGFKNSFKNSKFAKSFLKKSIKNEATHTFDIAFLDKLEANGDKLKKE